MLLNDTINDAVAYNYCIASHGKEKPLEQFVLEFP